METLLARLRDRGLEIHFETEWIGEVGVDRRQITTDEIRAITVPLTPEEWCSMCMRNGEAYIGGCCGTSGYTQDILNEIFRNSGTIDGRGAWELIQTGGSHDGHEALTEKDESKLLEQEAAWDSLYPHQKVMLCVGAVRDRLPMSWLDTPKRTNDTANPESVIYALFHGAQYLNYKDLYSNADELPDTKSGQKHGNVALALAKVVPAAKAFLEIAAQVEKLPFNGFGVVNDKNELVQNGYGLCLYHERVSAEDLVKAWQKAKHRDGEEEFLNALTIKPVRVSIENGLEVL